MAAKKTPKAKRSDTRVGSAVLVRMPDALKKRITADAYERGTNMTDLINGILSKHYKVHYDPASRLSSPHAHRRTVPFGGGRRSRAAA